MKKALRILLTALTFAAVLGGNSVLLQRVTLEQYWILLGFAAVVIVTHRLFHCWLTWLWP